MPINCDTKFYVHDDLSDTPRQVQILHVDN